MKHTLETLTAMSDAELNELAATLVHGWRLTDLGHWLFADKTGPRFSNRPHYQNYYRPTVDRNQSGELLAKMVERGAEFEISLYGHVDFDDITALVPERDWNDVISGNGPRSETIAALIAHVAMEEPTNG